MFPGTAGWTATLLPSTSEGFPLSYVCLQGFVHVAGDYAVLMSPRSGCSCMHRACSLGACARRWPGHVVPVVQFLDGREVLALPERFCSRVPSSGECCRIQARAHAQQVFCMSAPATPVQSPLQLV